MTFYVLSPLHNQKLKIKCSYLFCFCCCCFLTEINVKRCWGHFPLPIVFFLMLFPVNIFKETGFGGNYYSQSVLKFNLSQLCGHPYFYFGQNVVYGKLDSFDVASFLPKWSTSPWQKTEKFKTHWHNWMAFNNLFSCIVVMLWLTQKKNEFYLISFSFLFVAVVISSLQLS